jgi:hypothetical protein
MFRCLKLGCYIYTNCLQKNEQTCIHNCVEHAEINTLELQRLLMVEGDDGSRIHARLGTREAIETAAVAMKGR